MSTWLVLGGATVITFLCRTVVLVGFAGRALPGRLLGWLQLAGPAALAALAATHLATADHGGVDLAVVLAAATGFVAVRRTGNVLAALAVGMPVLWAAHALGLH
jgi:branched-subunit amino acid transport protein